MYHIPRYQREDEEGLKKPSSKILPGDEMVLLLEMVRDSVADKVLAEKENAGNRSKTEKSTPLMSPHNILVFLFFLSLFVEKIICKFEDLIFHWRYRTCFVLNA